MASELHAEVLAVCKIAEDLGIKIALVGALVSEFTPEIGPDYPRFRRTNDADFAVYVADWKSFKRLRARLIESDFKLDPKREHRLTKPSIMIDLIPYGEGIAPGGKFRWPDSGFEMNVVGFKEVCDAANKEVKKGSPIIPIITIPGFLLLKIITFLERYAQRNPEYKDDARDIDYWLHHYASGAEDSRRYDFAAKLGRSGLDYESAGAALLGSEVGALASRAAARFIGKFLRESSDAYSPFIDALAFQRLGDEDKNIRNEAQKLLEAFKRGFEITRKGA